MKKETQEKVIELRKEIKVLEMFIREHLPKTYISVDFNRHDFRNWTGIDLENEEKNFRQKISKKLKTRILQCENELNKM